MKNIMSIVALLIIAVSGYSQQKATKSIGGTIGYSAMLTDLKFNGVSWGSYVDFGHFGLEYSAIGNLNLNPQDANDFINGTNLSFTSGYAVWNAGFFAKFNPEEKNCIYLGLGLQSVTEIGAQMVTQRVNYGRSVGYVSVADYFQERKMGGYFSIGVLSKVNESFSLKAGLIVGTNTSMNFGIGLNL